MPLPDSTIPSTQLLRHLNSSYFFNLLRILCCLCDRKHTTRATLQGRKAGSGAWCSFEALGKGGFRGNSQKRCSCFVETHGLIVDIYKYNDVAICVWWCISKNCLLVILFDDVPINRSLLKIMKLLSPVLLFVAVEIYCYQCSMRMNRDSKIHQRRTLLHDPPNHSKGEGRGDTFSVAL